MVRVDANVVGFQVESILAVFHMLQFVLVQIWPSPQPGVDHVRETFTSSHLNKANRRGRRELLQKAFTKVSLMMVTQLKKNLLLYLQATIQSSLYGHTLAGMSSVGGDGRDEGIQLVFLLLQLFYQTFDGSLGEALALASLSVAHEAVHNAQAGIIARGSVCDGHLASKVSALGRIRFYFFFPFSSVLYRVPAKESR